MENNLGDRVTRADLGGETQVTEPGKGGCKRGQKDPVYGFKEYPGLLNSKERPTGRGENVSEDKTRPSPRWGRGAVQGRKPKVGTVARGANFRRGPERGCFLLPTTAKDAWQMGGGPMKGLRARERGPRKSLCCFFRQKRGGVPNAVGGGTSEGGTQR